MLYKLRSWLKSYVVTMSVTVSPVCRYVITLRRCNNNGLVRRRRPDSNGASQGIDVNIIGRYASRNGERKTLGFRFSRSEEFL